MQQANTSTGRDIEGTKRYRQKKVEGATNLKQIEDMAMEIALEMRENEKK